MRMMATKASASTQIFSHLLFLVVMTFVSGIMAEHSELRMCTWSKPDVPLNQMKLSKNTGNLYIGANNHIYQLDTFLRLLSEASTAHGTTDNVNKYLILNATTRGELLTTCGSKDDFCSLRLGQNILLIVSNVSLSLPVNVKGAVAFTADFEDERFLFVACPNGTDKDGVCSSFSGIVWGQDKYRLTKSIEEYTLRFTEPKAKEGIITKAFVGGFPIGNRYRLFFSIQKDLKTGNVTSRVAHMCQKKYGYRKRTYSYVDMPLRCGDFMQIRSVSYEEISNSTRLIVALFVRESEGGTDSAVCVFTLKDIHDKVIENVRDCLNGTKKPKEDYMYDTPSRCVAKAPDRGSSDYPDYYLCAEHGLDTVSKIIGDRELAKHPVLNFTSEHMTAMTVTSLRGTAIAYLCSSNGDLVKVSVYPSVRARTLLRLAIPQESPGSCLGLEVMDSAVFVMTPHQVSKVMMETCGDHKTCSECLGSMDPYCGWCMLAGRCDVDKSCPMEWLSAAEVTECPVISDVQPAPILPTDVVTQLFITVSSLPTKQTKFVCEFESDNVLAKGTRSLSTVENRTVVCDGPDLRRVQGDVLGTLNVSVAVVYVSDENVSLQLLARGNLIFYNCATFKSCLACTNPSWNCMWCIDRNRCVANGANMTDSCDSNTTVTSASSECPVLDGFASTESLDDSTTLYLHKGVENDILLTGHNLPRSPPSPTSKYSCRLSPFPSHFEAVWINSSMIRCNNVSWVSCCTINMAYTPYASQREDISANGSIPSTLLVYLDSLPVDASVSLRVDLYDCARLVRPAGNCGACKALKQHYLCRWCDAACQYQEKCPEGRSPLCLAIPTIIEIFPKSAHPKGRTRLLISGLNFGWNAEEVKETNITVAGVPCVVGVKHFIPSKRFNCTLEQRQSPGHGEVVISLPARSTVTYQQHFVFRVPVIEGIVPAIGPRSGGTSVTIHGKHLDTGRKQEAFIGDIPCLESRTINESACVCKTRIADEPSAKQPGISFDEAMERWKGTFQYTEDPTVTDIYPHTSFQGGGRRITVVGTNFHAVQKPAMRVTHRWGHNHATYQTNCAVSQNGTRMFCRSPELTSYSWLKTRGPSIECGVEQPKRTYLAATTISFLMDNVTRLQNLSNYFPNVPSTLVYHDNPEVYNFTGIKQRAAFLVIKGSRLLQSAGKEDIKVTVGMEMCNLSSVVNEAITCIPPFNRPAADDDNLASDSAPLIRVSIGNLKYVVGRLEYEKPASSSGSRRLSYIIAGLVIGVLLLVLLHLAIGLYVVIRKRRLAKRDRQYLAHKMDKFEAAIRTQCREEFAALQMAVADVTSEFEEGSNFYRDFHQYACNVLFWNNKAHPAISPPVIMDADAVKAMGIFRGLLQDQRFLRLMISAFETEASFTMQNKSNLAAMLIVTNEDNMEYITEVLKGLLNDLMEKTIQAQTQKLMLRRSESVVEKLLTYWLAICLYGYLKGGCGSSLYLLYKAIKIQTERGPVDHISCRGKYTLSEDKLLPAREKDINAQPLTLMVLHKDVTVEVSVLDCDTVTQAKSKMLDVLYKNVPYSQRPAVNDTALETQDEDSTTRILLDEDGSSVKEGNWTRLNTLQHYSVSDGSSVVLSVRGEAMYPVLQREESQDGSKSLKRSKQGPRRVNSSYLWHLTKEHPSDDDEVRLSSDVFLPRLLNTKATLQKYIDDFFTDVLAVGEEPPLVIKYLFDFLDSAALRLRITDPDVLHTWKCNSLLLRFWVNTIKNPEFVFDIHKPLIVDSCLSVVAQTLMDSCSTAPLQLGKFSPSAKLLFARDIPRYRDMVNNFFRQLSEKPAISDQDLNAFLQANVSQKFSGNFSQINSLLEIYKFAELYKDQLLIDLDMEAEATPGVYEPLAAKLRQVVGLMGPKDTAT